MEELLTGAVPEPREELELQAEGMSLDTGEEPLLLREIYGVEDTLAGETDDVPPPEDGTVSPADEKPPTRGKKKTKRGKEAEEEGPSLGGEDAVEPPPEADDTAREALEAGEIPEQEPVSAEHSVAGDRAIGDMPPTQEERPAQGKTEAAKQKKPAQGHRHYRSLDLAALDRNLTDQEKREWNAIYASFGSKSLLNGPLMGLDDTRFYKRGPGGVSEQVMVRSGIVINYRVKVMIPEPEMWMPDQVPPDYVLNGVVGASLDYVITDIDREGEVALASRRMALAAKRRYFASNKNGHQPGEKLKCVLLSVGPTRCLVECQGYDIELRPHDLSYTRIEDLREVYRPGDVLDCVLVNYSPANGLAISVKGVERNPFDGVELRHPVRSRRQAVITGKYAGGIYCTLPDNVVCLCLYTSQLCDEDFQIGDKVILFVEGYIYDLQRMRGRIITKW